ncbi:hypothetical protein CQR46_1584 [Bifidobacterium pseudolongum subsp. globosum]|uniref:Uncharacterized protein n=1 Tax=Bifidobacterium pseudolongum subsp. globosum TaxID=1690 RepID=A0A2N3QEC6_9BIFI|nr:hypothetical protein CQR46_1584 [Bifidobacterium pseudolongum subsp. globosum]
MQHKAGNLSHQYFVRVCLTIAVLSIGQVAKDVHVGVQAVYSLCDCKAENVRRRRCIQHWT